ncbi:MAG TPA: hypothetical protein VL020_04965 [Pseudomonadales bacterium]|nr:hypothetical protein [Pseudomonadales bacterium]
MTIPQETNSEYELKHLYRCIMHDFHDGTEREDMWVKEIRLAIKAREQAAVERVLDELVKSSKHYTDVTLEADALDPWGVPVGVIEAKRQSLKENK